MISACFLWIAFSVGTKTRRDSVADSALQIGGGGGGGHLDPKIRRGEVKEIFFRPFGLQFGLKIGGGPPLDPPLGLNYILCPLRYVTLRFDHISA